MGISVDDAAWGHSVFSKNRDRLLEGDIAAKFLSAILDQPKVRRLLSSDHFSVGRVAFAPETLHDLRSCSKSLVALLDGTALDRGFVPPPEAALFSAFPEHADLAHKDGRDQLTIHHVPTMSMGTDWDESSRVYSAPATARPPWTLRRTDTATSSNDP